MSHHGRRRTRALLCGVAALLCSSLAIAPAARAEAPTVSWPAASMNGLFVSASSHVGNTFTAKYLGRVTRVRVNVDRDSCAAVGTDLKIQLWNTDANGAPRDVLAERVVLRDQVPLRSGSIQTLELTWPHEVTLNAGSRYFLAASATGSQTFCGFSQPYTWRVSGVAEPGERQWNRSGAAAAWTREACINCLELGLEVFTDAPDRDGDLVPDGADNCPDDANADQANLDGDARGDACDTDVDGDGVDNAQDAFPRDKDESKDTDGDGTGNNADGDDDGDGHADAEDLFPLDAGEWADVDADGTGDNADTDDDNDTVADDADNCTLLANADQADLDGDSKGDVCDSDRDGDAVDNGVDNCADVANDQVDTDADGSGDACDADDDNDGFADAEDNCPTVASSSQRDSDGDGKGDACDGTFDSTDGLTAGGGWITGAGGGKVHFAYSALSNPDGIAGIGELRDATRRIRLVTADGYSQNDDRAIVVGDAIVDGARVRYRLEAFDGGEPGRGVDTIELEAGEHRWAGTLAGGNLQVGR